MLRVWIEYLRGACASAAALEDRRKTNLLSIAIDSSDRIRRAGTPFAKALALLLDGLRFAGQGRSESAAQSFEEVEVALDSLAMAMFAAAARYARGLLTGGVKGRQLKNDSQSNMLKPGVRRPERIAHMLCPVLSTDLYGRPDAEVYAAGKARPRSPPGHYLGTSLAKPSRKPSFLRGTLRPVN